MQISLKWINELVHIENIKLDDLVNKLTLGGFEVEDIIEIQVNKTKHITLDISATANRSDSLSIQGISAEIGALLNIPLNISNNLHQSEKLKQTILEKAIILPESKECTTFLAFSIQHLTDKTIPTWIKRKLISSGLTPSNTLADFQSYLLLETGYPFAFYDLDKIQNKLKRSSNHGRSKQPL